MQPTETKTGRPKVSEVLELIKDWPKLSFDQFAINTGFRHLAGGKNTWSSASRNTKETKSLLHVLRSVPPQCVQDQWSKIIVRISGRGFLRNPRRFLSEAYASISKASTTSPRLRRTSTWSIAPIVV